MFSISSTPSSRIIGLTEVSPVTLLIPSVTVGFGVGAAVGVSTTLFFASILADLRRGTTGLSVGTDALSVTTVLAGTALGTRTGKFSFIVSLSSSNRTVSAVRDVRRRILCCCNTSLRPNLMVWEIQDWKDGK